MYIQLIWTTWAFARRVIIYTQQYIFLGDLFYLLLYGTAHSFFSPAASVIGSVLFWINEKILCIILVLVSLMLIEYKGQECEPVFEHIYNFRIYRINLTKSAFVYELEGRPIVI